VRKCLYTRLVQIGLLTASVAAAAGAAQAQRQDEIAVLKAAYARPPARPVTNQQLVELGRRPFWDPRLSASGSTACVNCHQPYLGWAMAEPRSRGDSGRPTSRKSQSLLGIGHAEDVPVGWDGRNPTLEAQIKSSIAGGSMSMKGTDKPVKVEMIVARVQAIPDYGALHQAATPGKPLDIEAIAAAIAAYERTIEPGIAPFDRWVGGDEDAISESAKRGFALFNGAAGCAGCHTGWRLTDDAFHDIGTSTKDLGRGKKHADDPTAPFAFKTPTLRSVALRPPYMHDGSAATLYDVVRHYERGGIDRPSRSPMLAPITLSEADRLDLVAFMQTLTGIPEGEAAPPLPGL
jgi:cytochrome c peroxidase